MHARRLSKTLAGWGEGEKHIASLKMNPRFAPNTGMRRGRNSFGAVAFPGSRDVAAVGQFLPNVGSGCQGRFMWLEVQG